MSKKVKEEVQSPVDILRDEATELRLKAITLLEKQVRKGDMDSTEAFAAFLSITRFPPELAASYLNSFSESPELWRQYA